MANTGDWVVQKLHSLWLSRKGFIAIINNPLSPAMGTVTEDVTLIIASQI